MATRAEWGGASRRGRRSARRLAAAVALATAGVAPAVAQPGAAPSGASPPPAADEASLEELIERSRRDPADQALAYAVARRALATGDFEAAIGALERLLAFDPAQPGVRLELGVLYYRLGSYAFARTLLERAAAEAGEAEPEVRERAAGYLAAIDDLTGRHVLLADLTLGVRLQSNPTAAGEPDELRAADGRRVRADADEEGDLSLFSRGAVSHTYRFPTQWDDAVVTRVGFYGEAFRERTTLDFSLVELESGPRVELGRLGLAGLSLRPFATAAHATLDREYYFASVGGGLELRQAAAAGVEGRVRLGTRRQAYTGADDGDDSRRTGWRTDAALGLGWAVTPRDLVDVALYLDRLAARDDARAYAELGAALVYARDVALGAGLGGAGPLTLYVGAAVARARYDGRDPDFEPGRARRDWTYDGRVGAVLPFRPWLAAVGELERREVRSNVGFYQYGNTVGTLGVRLRF